MLHEHCSVRLLNYNFRAFQSLALRYSNYCDVKSAVFSASDFLGGFFHPHDPQGSPLPPSYNLPVALSMALFLAEIFHIQRRTRIRVSEVGGRSPHRSSSSWTEERGGEKEKKKKGGAETGLVLMTDNPVTNSWSSSKGWLSRLWLCDVNGTWSSESAEAQRKGSQFSLHLPQTCPLLWYPSTHFASKLSGLLCRFCLFLNY